MITFLKGDTTASITLALAEGFDYSGKTVHLEYQGVQLAFPGAVAGGSLVFCFTARETASMSLGAYPVHVWIEDGSGNVTTIHNADVKMRVTDCIADVHGGGAIYLDVRGGLSGIDGLPERYTDKDVHDKINEILRRLGGTVAALLLCAMPAFGVSLTLHTAPKGAIYNDEQIVTNVTIDVSDLAAKTDVSNSVAAVDAALALKADAHRDGSRDYQLAYSTVTIRPPATNDFVYLLRAVSPTNWANEIILGPTGNPLLGQPQYALSLLDARDGSYLWELRNDTYPAFAVTNATASDAAFEIVAPDAKTYRIAETNVVIASDVAYLGDLAHLASESDLAGATNALANSSLSRTGWSITSPGVITDWLAAGATGGPRIRGSSHSLDDYTAYAYNGIVYRRGGQSQDYLFDEADDNGIVRRKELAGISTAETDPVWSAQKSGYATVGAVGAISNNVAALETWAIGENVALQVDDAGETNATYRILYTNDLMYASAIEHTNTLNKARAYADETAAATYLALDDAKADKSWGDYTSGGAPSPDDELIIEKKSVALTGGGNYSFVESSTGGYWVMSVSLGSTWSLESLADAQNPTNPATMTIYDAERNAVQTVTSTSSREAYAVDGEQYIFVRDDGNGNDVITIVYPIVADSAPTLLFSPVPAPLDDFYAADHWPTNIASVVSSGSSGMWTNTVTMAGKPGKGFFRGKYTKAGTVYTHFDKPLGFAEIVIGGTNYHAHVETINGKKLLVLEDI